MIVIEGPDGAGKTTLLNDLQRGVPRLTLQSRHSTSEGGPISNLVEWVEHHLVWNRPNNPHRRRLYDRFPLISEPIYGPAIRGGVVDKFNNPLWLAEAWAEFWSHDPLIVVCLPPLRVVRANLSMEPQMAGVRENIDRIWWSYYSLMVAIKGAGKHVVCMNYMAEYETRLASLIDYARERVK